MHRLRFLVVLLMGVCSMPALGQTLQIDLAQTDQQLLGFGGQIWAGDDDGHSVLSDLNMRYARLHHGVNFYTFPVQPPTDGNTAAGDNFQVMKNHIAANFNGPNNSEPWHLPSILSTNAWAQQNGVELIINEFQIEHSFLNAQNTEMASNRVDDFATFWGALLSYLDDNGVRPAYIELANEPNGTWNGRITPTDYNTLVQQTRSVLDTHGFTDVGILGPGLSVLGNTSWVDALDTGGVNALEGWSTHTWDDFQGIDNQAAIFENAIDAKDPNKPVYVTEYATTRTIYDGVDYISPDFGGTAADQEAYAVEVISNTLSMVNNGAGALLVWEAADQPWNSIKWGLERLDGTRRPTFDAMKELLDRLPDDSTVVEKTWTDNEITTAAFLTENQLIIALANTLGRQERRTLNLANAPGELTFLEGVQYKDGAVTPLAYSLSGDSISVTLPQESTQTLVFDIATSAMGDLDGDGDVDIADVLAIQQGGTADDLADWIAAFGTGSAVQASVTAVPEPSSAMILLGLAGLAAGARRRSIAARGRSL